MRYINRPRAANGVNMQNVGNVWMVAIAALAGMYPDARGSLYLSEGGDLVLCSDADAPNGASYIARYDSATDPMFLAARLRHVACSL